MADDKITDRVRKLFAKAESVGAQTPEGTVFLERAFALLAKYGIDEALARSGGTVDAADILTETITVRGKYRLDQAQLISTLARALHCDSVRARDSRDVVVVGARRHMDRLLMLEGFLRGLMLAEASRTQSPYPGLVSTVAHRKSFMVGFAMKIYERIDAAESTAVSDSGDSTGVELVLASDADRAADEMARLYPTVERARRRQFVGTGINAGRDAASQVDLGQSRVGGARPALTA